ncbi:protein FAR1-RELATED SEQUENCE 5-like [Salvia hispanica]|uniref:protein FAR1-RELATED SEQUENCE 5-like n=1 Tax=Salvia hispanica TaxID=49212 RepID=UPI002008F517|nr:protein FAR1-RELATED SEQUENCE 5-like [Salvia hispanica]
MNGLRNPGGSIFITDSDSDSKLEAVLQLKLKPYIGQIFLKLDDATEFYNKYARHVGFDTRKHGSKKKVDHITWLYVVCSREGQRKMKMQGHESKRRRSSRKCFCKAKIAFKFCKGIGYVVNQFDERHCASANIGPTLTFKLPNEVLGGLDHVGCTVVEVRNYRRDLRAFTSGADAQMVLNEMSRKKENCPAFIYHFEVNSKDRLTRLFWCDPTAKKNFHLYGDIDLGMKVVVERVLVDTRHRWCMWHIMFKVVEKLPKNLLVNEDLKKELNNCVWSELIEPEEFDEAWDNVMEKYGLKDHEWFSSMDFPMSSLIKTTSISESQNIFFKRYSKSHSNLVEFLMNYNNALDGQRSNNNRLEYLDFNKIPTLKTNSALERHASTIYSDSGFKLLQSEIEEAVDNVTMVTVSIIGENKIYVVNDMFSKNWTVSYSTSFASYACSCKMFGRIGLEYRDMQGDFYDIARLIEGDGDKILAFRHIMAKESEIEVHPCDVVKTKSPGRRLSCLEKEMREMSKPGRKCAKCGEVGRHDSRNCDKIQEEKNKKKRRNQC